MRCTTCGIDVPSGKACPKCGKGPSDSGLGGGYSYDLLPDEPAKTKSADGPGFVEPEGPLPPPGPMPGIPSGGEERDPLDKEPLKGKKDGPRGAAAGGSSMLSGGNRPLIIGAAVVVLAIMLFVYFKPPKPEVKGVGAKLDNKSYTVQPEKAQVVTFEVRGKGKAEFSITATAQDGDLVVGLGKRSPRDPSTNVALRKALEFFKDVKPGQAETLEGEIEAGTWAWIILNESKKPLRIKVNARVE